jgi:hypothetical protein
MIMSAPYQVTDAAFRLWGSRITAAMEAVGFTKTADTGQINWTTVLAPTGSAEIMGYEIRQFTDGLQATNPVIVKLEYGSSATSNQRPGIRITVGSASDGAGALTGNVSSYFYIASTGGSTTEYPSYISSDGGRINIALWVTSSSNSNAFWIERFKDTDGTPNANGVNICSAFSTNSRTTASTAQTLPAAAVAYPASPIRFQCAITSIGATYNENIGLFPVYPNQGYAGNPDLGGLVFNSAEMSAAGTFMTISIYGSSHVFVVVESLNTSVNAVTSACNLLVRCE